MKHVLIFSIAADIHADRIAKLLPPNVGCIRLNLDDPAGWRLSFVNGEVQVSTPSQILGMGEISSVFVRRIPNIDAFKRTIAPHHSKYADYIAHQQFGLFSDCLAVLDSETTFVNPLASASRSGKAVQAVLAASVGLLTPETYMGSDPAVATTFARMVMDRSNQVCTKPIANTEVTIDGEKHTRFTELLSEDDLGSMHSLAACPLIFQQYVKKAYEIRAAVIGDRIFAARIDSQAANEGTATDWRRYDIPKTPHYPYTLSEEVASKLIALQRKLGLIYSSFDLIRTPTGDYVFLETNPFGQWLWIEDLTGLPITSAIAEYLAQPP